MLLFLKRINIEEDMNQETGPLFNDDDYIDILNRYKEMIREGKKCFFDVNEYELLFEYFIQHGDLENLNKTVDIGIQQHPDSSKLMIKKAQLFIDKGDYLHALEILEDIEKYETGNYELFLLKGIVYNFIGRQKETNNYFEKAIEISGTDLIDCLFSIAVNYENIDDYTTALNYLQIANTKDSENLTVLFELGICYDRLENYENAIKIYNLCIDIGPFSDMVWFNLGVVYSKINEYDKAIETFDFALAINDKYYLAYFNKGNIFLNKGNYEKAIEAYKEYLVFEENHTETLCFIGECYERIGKLGIASDYYHKSLSTNPNFSDAVYGIGIIHSLRENYRDSISFIQKAIDINPYNSDYWFSLGNVYSAINQTDKAIHAYSRSTELDPHDYESWLNLSELFYKKNLLTRAIKILENAYSHNFNIAVISYRLAAYNFLRNNISEGILYFKRGIKNNFIEHEETFKLCPEASGIKEIKELIRHFNSVKQ